MDIRKILFLFDREEYTVDFAKESIEKTYTYMCDQFPLSPHIEIEKFYNEFSKFNVQNWTDNYVGEDFASKERWELQVLYNDESKNIRLHGKAKFPERFFDLKKLFEETEKEALKETN